MAETTRPHFCMVRKKCRSQKLKIKICLQEDKRTGQWINRQKKKRTLKSQPIQETCVIIDFQLDTIIHTLIYWELQTGKQNELLLEW